ncbi:hypothetical protein BLA29_005590 [Euroglyphus maynei]|uniref:Uncharacterized protein n=1 Tax=Euroglyphus maynei TaxID=6958 RepID=A0A1Y3BLS5_EURMA|nr:hypothetical protein BLA29_005590 [Euroglyphus maynei]
MLGSKQLNLESCQSEQLVQLENLIFDEQDDFNPESLNSDISQVTCIKINQQQRQPPSTSGGRDPQLLDDFDPLVPSEQQTTINQQAMLSSMDSNINPVLDCDFSSLGSSMMSMSAGSMDPNNNDSTILQCDDVNVEHPHPALYASMTQSIEQATATSDDRIVGND